MSGHDRKKSRKRRDNVPNIDSSPPELQYFEYIEKCRIQQRLLDHEFKRYLDISDGALLYLSTIKKPDTFIQEQTVVIENASRMMTALNEQRHETRFAEDYPRFILKQGASYLKAYEVLVKQAQIQKKNIDEAMRLIALQLKSQSRTLITATSTHQNTALSPEVIQLQRAYNVLEQRFNTKAMHYQQGAFKLCDSAEVRAQQHDPFVQQQVATIRSIGHSIISIGLQRKVPDFTQFEEATQLFLIDEALVEQAVQEGKHLTETLGLLRLRLIELSPEGQQELRHKEEELRHLQERINHYVEKYIITAEEPPEKIIGVPVTDKLQMKLLRWKTLYRDNRPMQKKDNIEDVVPLLQQELLSREIEKKQALLQRWYRIAIELDRAKTDFEYSLEEARFCQDRSDSLAIMRKELKQALALIQKPVFLLLPNKSLAVAVASIQQIEDDLAADYTFSDFSANLTAVLNPLEAEVDNCLKKLKKKLTRLDVYKDKSIRSHFSKMESWRNYSSSELSEAQAYIQEAIDRKQKLIKEKSKFEEVEMLNTLIDFIEKAMPSFQAPEHDQLIKLKTNLLNNKKLYILSKIDKKTFINQSLAQINVLSEKFPKEGRFYEFCQSLLEIVRKIINKVSPYPTFYSKRDVRCKAEEMKAQLNHHTRRH